MFYILFTIITFCLFTFTYAAESCLTPNNTQGLCQNVLKCPSLASMLDNVPVKQEDKVYLRESQLKCSGFDGVIPMVCCPLEEAVTKNITESVTKVVTIPETSWNTNLLPSLDECGTGTEDKIWLGKVTEILDHPWMALIHHKRANGQGYYHCGGVLINSRYVLTAAHCVKAKVGWIIDSVRLGEHNLTSSQDCDYFNEVPKCAPSVQDIEVEQEIVHENYQFNPPHINRHYDIALLRLKTPAETKDNVKPICLPIHHRQRNKDLTGLKMKVAGFGVTENKTYGSDVKMAVTIPIVTNTQCASQYLRGNIYVIDSQICAGGGRDGKDACNGDSGGPLMSYESNDDEGTSINWYVYGIVSYGTSKCGIGDWPGVYTRVTSFIPWILNNMRP